MSKVKVKLVNKNTNFDYDYIFLSENICAVISQEKIKNIQY